MRKALLATASALVLLNATPARADIGPGDLGKAAEHIADSVVEAISNLADLLCMVIAKPFENLPTVALPMPPPAPVDGHIEGEPLTLEQAQEYASQRVEDRAKRVEALDSAAKAALAASQQAGVNIQALSAANVSPASAVAGIQMNTAMAAAAAGDQMAQTQLLAAQVSMQADQAQQQEQARAINQAQIKALYGDIQGGKIEATQFRSWW